MDDLHKHFKDLFGFDQEVMTQDDLNENISNDFLDSDIMFEELKKAIFSQNNNKSSGIDGQLDAHTGWLRHISLVWYYTLDNSNTSL